MYSIQGIKTVGNSLPKTINKILKKGGHNYSSIINNWVELVGKETSLKCYPKSVKTNREFKDGVLVLNVSHGDQLDIEYDKRNIIDKINSFFGYNFIKRIKISLIDNKIKIKNENTLMNIKEKKLDNKIDQIENLKIKKRLIELAKQYENKNNK